MDGVAATENDPKVPGFPAILSLLEDEANKNPRLHLERLATLTLEERPLIVVCLKALEPHIRVILGAQFVTPYFAQPIPEDSKVFAFASDTCLGLLPEIVVVKPEWITPGEFNPRLPPDTPRPNRVSVPRASLTPLYLFHPLMVSPFLELATAWHMMHAKANAMGMIQRLALLLD